MAWGKAAQIAYQHEIELELFKLPVARPPIREPFCTVRVGQSCQFTVADERYQGKRCWYCLLTKEQIAAGLTLGDVLGVKRQQVQVA